MSHPLTRCAGTVRSLQENSIVSFSQGTMKRRAQRLPPVFTEGLLFCNRPAGLEQLGRGKASTMSDQRLIQIVQHRPPLQASRLHHRQQSFHEAAARLALTPERHFSPQHRQPQHALDVVVRRFDAFHAHERLRCLFHRQQFPADRHRLGARAISFVRSVEPVSTTRISSNKPAVGARQCGRFASSFFTIRHSDTRCRRVTAGTGVGSAASGSR